MSDYRVCPKCGHQQSLGPAYCEQCGHPYIHYGSSNMAIPILLLVLIGLPSLAMGACFTLASFGGGQGSAPWLAIGIGLLAIFGLTLYFVIASARKR